MAEENVIDVFCNRINFDKDKIKSKELGRIEVDSFNLSDFWAQFGAAVQALSNEVTKLGFMCGKKPFPSNQEVTAMLQDVVQYYTVMKDLYLVLPEEVGDTLFQAVTSAIVTIMSALHDIVQSLKDLSDQGSKERLAFTGTFWDACNAVDNLPRDNLQATLKVIQGETALAVDAQEELDTTITEDKNLLREAGDVDDDDLWTNTERELATNAVGLVKVTHLSLQRLLKAVQDCGSCSTPQHCEQLDQTTALVRTVSPALDEFVSELYHPVDVTTALENASKLVQVLRSLLNSVRGYHYEQAFSADVVNKLLHFISHNHHKLDPQYSDPVPQLANLSFYT